MSELYKRIMRENGSKPKGERQTANRHPDMIERNNQIVMRVKQICDRADRLARRRWHEGLPW